MPMVTDAAWAVWAPLIEEVRPRGKTPPQDLRRTLAALVWRHQNGAKWRRIPAELRPWWRAAQPVIRWANRGVRERLLARARARGVSLGLAVIDGTTIRAHPKAAGAEKGGPRASRAAGATAQEDRCAGRLPVLDRQQRHRVEN